MRFNHTVKFLSATISFDNLGMPIATEVSTADVPCIKEKVGVTEFYQSMAAGLKPDIRIKVRSAEYTGQPYMTFDSRRYKVTRTQDDKGFTVIVGELVGMDQVVL